MTHEEKTQVDELIRNSMRTRVLSDALIEIVEARSRMVNDLLRTLATARSERSEAVVLASSWNPYRIWNS